MEEQKNRDCMEVLMHHIQVIAGGDVEEILTDYDPDIIAFSYEDDGIQVIHGIEDQRKQTRLVCTKDGAPPNLETGPLKITFMQGIGDYAVLALHADPVDVFGAHTFISRDGKAVYTTSYNHQPHRFLNGEKPIRIGRLSESGEATRRTVEEYLQVIASGDLEAARAMRKEGTLLITDLENQMFVGQDAVCAFWDKYGNSLRESEPHYIVDEAEGPLAFLVYQNEQGMTAETYLVEDGKVVFESIIHRKIVCG